VAAGCVLTDEDALAAVSKAKNGAAAGPSGWRNEHIRATCDEGVGLTAVTLIMQRVAVGEFGSASALGNLLLLCLSTRPPLCRLVALERNATVSFPVVWECGTPRFPIRHGVDGNTPARNPACALHLPDTSGPSSPTSPPVLPRCSTNDYVQFTAPACSPQRPGTLAGAGRAYLTRWRRGPGLSYLLGRAGLTLASPYATFRWPCDEPACQRLWKLRSLRSDRCFLIGSDCGCATSVQSEPARTKGHQGREIGQHRKLLRPWWCMRCAAACLLSGPACWGAGGGWLLAAGCSPRGATHHS
jgi:hypothetical protein